MPCSIHRGNLRMVWLPFCGLFVHWWPSIFHRIGGPVYFIWVTVVCTVALLNVVVTLYRLWKSLQRSLGSSWNHMTLANSSLPNPCKTIEHATSIEYSGITSYVAPSATHPHLMRRRKAWHNFSSHHISSNIGNRPVVLWAQIWMPFDLSLSFSLPHHTGKVFFVNLQRNAYYVGNQETEG